MTAARSRVRRCVFCGLTRVQLHHPTGQEWDPDITVPLCRNHHRLVEDDWWRAGIGPKAQQPTVLHVVAMGMSRWAMFLGRLAAAEVLPDLLMPLATWMADHALMVRDAVDGLDEFTGQGWRTAPGMIPEPL